jgi:hypothetical protein
MTLDAGSSPAKGSRYSHPSCTGLEPGSNRFGFPIGVAGSSPVMTAEEERYRVGMRHILTPT